ncbi:pkaR [Symbiodinium pilosum]|uniref:PkaR protein n=1 Tax=Symbiodinium pilosum TaxID=2952 RepID=A0A812P2D1_SYMPI|nr:pkaR [Symbiodinium pilosum]
MSQEHTEYIQSKVNPILESLVTEVLLERPDNPVPFMVRWLAERSKAGKDSLYSLGVGEAERLRNEIRELQDEIKALSDKVGDAKAKGEEKKEEGKKEELQGEAAAEAPQDSPGEKPTEKPAEKEEGASGGAKKEEEEAEEAEEAGPGKGKKDDDESEEEDDFGDDDEDDVDDDWKPPTAYMKKGQRGSVSAEAYGAFNQKQAFEPPVYEKSSEQEERINAVLSKSFLFNALSKDDLKVILGAFLEKKIPAGERIIQEGDDGDVMFLIESGAFDCIKKIDGSDKVVKKCGQGDVFGELALLYNCPRAASVEATEEAVVWQLDRETFSHIVRDASAKRRDNFMDFLKTVPLFKPLESYDLMQLADCLQQQTLEAGETILKQGDTGDTFYLVEEGDLVATKSRDGGAQEEVLHYKRGDYFGELALLKNEPRAATVSAKTESKICKIDRKSFKNILGQLEAQFKEAASKYKP